MSLVNANALRLPYADGVFQCAVTSPPYYGLRDYGVEGQLGLEPRQDCLGWATGAPCGECFVCRMVQVFREVRRTLRDDGVCFVNLGDSYASTAKGTGGHSVKQDTNTGSWLDGRRVNGIPDGLKEKDLCGIPWRVALALQADGWWLRMDNIWAKDNPMPESVTDRSTKSHEYVFQFAKSARYYYDAEAVKEGKAESTLKDPRTNGKGHRRDRGYPGEPSNGGTNLGGPDGTRNMRSVWRIPTQPYPGAHYATFPEALAERCILAGTSARGCCPVCGAAWKRTTDTTHVGWLADDDRKAADVRKVSASSGLRGNGRDYKAITTTLGWSPACACPPHTPVPCRVFDPFVGSGTVVQVARKHGRRGHGTDLSLTYLRENALPRAMGRNTDAALAVLPLFEKATL